MARNVWVAVALVVLVGVAIVILTPSVGSRPPTERVTAGFNFDEIAHALIGYAAVHGSLPARASFGKHGQPLLSWRVQILPNVGRIDLYNRFHLDEPWDSEHNKRLIPLMPHLYANPSTARRGMTNYLAVCGKRLMFDGEKGRQIAEIRDPENTIMAVEADDDHAVIWTKPEDWEFNPEHPMAGLGHAHPGGFFHPGNFGAVFADGHVQFIPENIDRKEFQAMLLVAESHKTVRPK